MTVYPGTQKVTFGRNSDTDYKSKLAAAKAQSGPNSYIQGVQSVMNEGAGEAVANSRTKYGAPTIMPNQVMEGADSNYANADSPGNQPLNDIPNQTGSVETQVSSTNVPQEDPQEMETDALSRRLETMAKGGQGFPGLNNRNREV